MSDATEQKNLNDQMSDKGPCCRLNILKVTHVAAAVNVVSAIDIFVSSEKYVRSSNCGDVVCSTSPTTVSKPTMAVTTDQMIALVLDSDDNPGDYDGNISTNSIALLEKKSASAIPILLHGDVRISRVGNVFEHKIRLHNALEMLFDARTDVMSAADSTTFIAFFLQIGKLSGVVVLWHPEALTRK